MRKILIFLGLLFVMLSGVYAQKGRQAIGFGLSYGTEIESIGLGLKYQYNITNPIRLEPSLNYFIENDNVSMLDINMNLHYLCPVAFIYKKTNRNKITIKYIFIRIELYYLIIKLSFSEIQKRTLFLYF